MAIMNRNFIITGAAQGLGLEFTRRALAGGGRVVMTDIQENVGNEAREKLEKEFGKGKVAFSLLDVRDEKRWRQVWDEAEEFFGGKVEALLNNAGLFNSNWKLMLDVNFGGLLTGTFLAMEKMGVSHGGSGGLIVQTASLASIIAGGFETIEENVYCATKWGVLGLTRVMAADKLYQRDKVRMLSIHPWLVNTGLVQKVMETQGTEQEIREKKWHGLSLMEPTEIGAAMEKLIVDGKSGQAMTVGPGISYYWPDHNRTLFIMLKMLHTFLVTVGRHPRTEPMTTNQMAWAAGALLFLLGILFHLLLSFFGL